MEYWKGKVAVVTGASAGIGADIVRDLAHAGLHVVGLARRKNRIEEIAKECAKAPGKIYAVECDLSNMDSISKAFEEIEKKLNVVHILINNAGRLKYGHFFDMNFPFEEVRATIDVNLTGLAACMRLAYKLMQKHQDNCYIINVNSVAGHITSSPDFLWGNIYGATKHGVTQLTQSLRLELNSGGNRRIKVTSLSPGGVDTDIGNASGVPTEIWDSFKQNPILSGKDLSSTVLYLLSTPPHLNITEMTVQATGEQL